MNMEKVNNTKKQEVPSMELIHSYSRAQAIEDGMLGDFSELGKEAGIVYPVAITSGMVAVINPSKYSIKSGQSFEGRLWDVFTMFKFYAKNNKGDTILFKVRIGRKNEIFKAVVGPGDTSEPVITMMLRNED